LLPYVSDLILYSACWEGAGTKLEDVSGGHNDGLLVGTAAWNAAGRIGNCLEFDGANGDVTIARKDYFTTPPFSIECWFRLDVLPSVRAEKAVLVEMGDSTIGYAAWNLLVTDAAPNDYIRFAVANNVPDDSKQIHSDSPCVINRWYHIVGTLDTSLNLKLYVDGVLQAETATAVSFLLGDETLVLGSTSPGPGGGQKLDGRLDEVRFYTRALSPAEIFEQWYRGLRQ